jgi:hypothetical protein
MFTVNVETQNPQANAEIMAFGLFADSFRARGWAMRRLFHDEVCATILGPSGLIVAGIKGTLLAIAHGFDPGGCDALAYQKFLG